MSTAAQERAHQTKQANRAFWLSVATLVVTFLGILCTLGYTIVHDRSQAKSFDQRFGEAGTRMGKFEAALRLMVANQAPAVIHELDEVLKAAREVHPSPAAASALDKASTNLALLTEWKIPLSHENDRAIRENLSDALTSKPDDPAVWNAAASFASYRSASFTGFENRKTQKCTDIPVTDYHPHPPGRDGEIHVITMGHCVLDLNAVEEFFSSSRGKLFLNEKAAGIADVLRFYLLDVQLIYRGGDMIPFVELQCQKCTLSSSINEVPPARAQKMIRQIAVADSLDNISISAGM